MGTLIETVAHRAPKRWKRGFADTESRLHQLAPYIGKLKPAIARDLISSYSRDGDWILDCFSGSGTIPLEGRLQGRNVIAIDRNPYAINLTRAKLEAPSTAEVAIRRAEVILSEAPGTHLLADPTTPEWVRQFFHPSTLREALAFANACIAQDEQFLLACLLGILHHQRPGFLSYPSSHLVPYLRDRKFPRSDYPDLYQARELRPRLIAKVRRALRSHSGFPPNRAHIVAQKGIAALNLRREVDAIITSPPYMNALDYVRDNRLRMWFLDRTTANYSPEPTDRSADFERLIADFAGNALSRLRRGGHCILVVGQTVRRKRITSHPAEHFLHALYAYEPRLELKRVIEDEIPDVRRSRRHASATKRELILVLKKL